MDVQECAKKRSSVVLLLLSPSYLRCPVVFASVQVVRTGTLIFVPSENKFVNETTTDLKLGFILHAQALLFSLGLPGPVQELF